MKINVRPIVIVEGKYDKIKLESLIDGLIFATDGFGIFKNKEAQNNLKTLARSYGAILLTDSDRAGFIIRKYLHDILQGYELYDIYIPDIYGKEKRKITQSAEGKLGVEGMPPEVLSELMGRFANPTINCGHSIGASELYQLGLYGGPDSKQKRIMFQHFLGLPGRLNKNMLLRILNSMFTKEQLYDELKKCQQQIK